MSMNMKGEHCPNCGCDLEEGQIGICEGCVHEDKESMAAHGFDAVQGLAAGRPLAAMGLTPIGGDPVRIALAACVEIIENLALAIVRNQEAWEGEEDSVKEEHAELIEFNAKTIAAYGRFAGVLADVAGVSRDGK